jgi:hypothetical protein
MDTRSLIVASTLVAAVAAQAVAFVHWNRLARQRESLTQKQGTSVARVMLPASLGLAGTAALTGLVAWRLAGQVYPYALIPFLIVPLAARLVLTRAQQASK